MEAVAPAEVKSETKEEEIDQNGARDQQIYGGEQDMDDEIDFNLGGGNGNGYDASSNHHEAHGPGIKEDG